ncbi:MAG: hypothetical protein NUW01_18830 [Gemmatimonadaceae bacterium]|nr:hypothetical protein [Gemmatimonadaceae bacterium]
MIHVAHFIAISCYAAAAALAAAPFARPVRAPGNGVGPGIIDAARYLFALSEKPYETETTPSIKDDQLKKERK